VLFIPDFGNVKNGNLMTPAILCSSLFLLLDPGSGMYKNQLCAHSCTHWLRPLNLTPPPHLGSYARALLVIQDRRHRFFDPLPWIHHTFYQFCGSMTFWCGSGSADPCLCIMDPDSDPDLSIFITDLHDANSKQNFIKFFLYITF
jgi:hypothetical protein